MALVDILLIDPPYRSLKGITPDCGYHLGLAYLSAYLRREGFDVGIISGDTILDLPKSSFFSLTFNLKKYSEGQEMYQKVLRDENHLIWKKIIEMIQKNSPSTVGITYPTPAKHSVEKIASLAKTLDRHINVIVGGHHPSHSPIEVMRNKDIDFVVRGEGEIPLLALMRELKKQEPDLSQVPGIHWRDSDGSIRTNPDASQISILDTLPFPARDPVIDADYRRYRIHMMSTARGCPNHCTFCADRSFWHRKVRHRSVENVLQELRDIERTYRNLQFVDFTDGTFTYDRDFVEGFCQRMIEENMGVQWRCTARYDDLDNQILHLMKKAGCFALYLGVESGSERILEMTGRNLHVAEMVEKSKLIHNTGIFSMASVMFGIPGETKDDVDKTLALMRKLKADLFDVNSYIPLPGTPLYDLLGKEQKENIDWSKIAVKSLENYFNEAISLEDQKQALLEGYRIATKKKKRFIVRFLWSRLRRNIDRCFIKEDQRGFKRQWSDN
jgi:anaerobic magnesium-protoporphyrin IX monomethyl ester cyclase